MTKRLPVLAITPLIAIASPLIAQSQEFTPEAAVDLAGPLRVEAPPFVDPVPFIAAEPPHLPSAVKAMIEEAVRSDDSAAVAAVVKVALATQPYDAEEIRGMQRAYLDGKASALAARTKEETERIRKAGVLALWKGQIELGAFRSTGNTDNFGFTGALKLDRKGINWEHTIQLNADYQKDAHTITREQYAAFYQPRYTLNDDLFTYGRVQYEKDKIQGFRDRYSLSGGLGYRILTGKKLNLSLEVGPAVRRTVYVGDPSETTWSTLMSLDFGWTLNDTIKLTQNASSYIGSDDSTFTSLTGIEAGMAKGLKAKFSYSFEHETSPPTGALRTDTISRFSLVYGF